MKEDNLNPVQPGQKGSKHPAYKPPRKRLQKTISLRVSNAEFDKIAALAGKDGLSPGKYIRKHLGLD